MKQFVERTEKILSRIEELANTSDDEIGITRIFGSKAFIRAREKVFYWMAEAGLQTSIDNIGNVRGRTLSTRAGALTFIIASHIDTVVNAGRFDGPLGVLMGVDIVEEIILSKSDLPFNIELIAFSDEEGVRFHSTFLGSRVVAGSFDSGLLEKTDEKGNTLFQVIQNMGGDAGRLKNDAILPGTCLGYFEVHIEQGPVLYEKNLPVAVVSAIAGQARIEVVFKGMAGHAGTVPMNLREDALCAASEFVLETEKYAVSKKDDIVATIGKLHIVHEASNVIPGEVICSLDVRSANEVTLRDTVASIRELGEVICNKRRIHFEWKLVQQTAAVACDQDMNRMLSACITEAGYERIALVSGAGHDAVPMSSISPVCMLFVRCFKGISHHPAEHADAKDISVALEIAANFIYELIKKHQ